jgi:hypothetical protein
MIKGNPLDFFNVTLPNGRGFPTGLVGSGWFSDDISFNPVSSLEFLVGKPTPVGNRIAIEIWEARYNFGTTDREKGWFADP